MHTQTNSTAIFQQTSGFLKFSFPTSSKSELLGINSKVLSKVRSHIYQPTTSTQSQSAHPNQRRPEKTTVASSAFLNSLTDTHTHTHTHTHPFNGPFYGTTWVSQYQKGKTNLDFTKARDSEWQWHQLDHM